MVNTQAIANVTRKPHSHIIRDILVMISEHYDVPCNVDMRFQDYEGVRFELQAKTNRIISISLDAILTKELMAGYGYTLG